MSRLPREAIVSVRSNSKPPLWRRLPDGLPPVAPKAWKTNPNAKPQLAPWLQAGYPEDCVGEDAIEVMLRWRGVLGWSTEPDKNAGLNTGKPLDPEKVSQQRVKSAMQDRHSAKAKVVSRRQPLQDTLYLNEGHKYSQAVLKCLDCYPDMYSLKISTRQETNKMKVYYLVTPSAVDMFKDGSHVETIPLLRFAWERDITRDLLEIDYFKHLRVRVLFTAWKDYTREVRTEAKRIGVLSTSLMASPEKSEAWLQVQALCQRFFPAQDRMLPRNKAWWRIPLESLWKEMMVGHVATAYSYHSVTTQPIYPEFGRMKGKSLKDGVDAALAVPEYFAHIEQQLADIRKKHRELQKQVVKCLLDACLKVLIARNYPDYVEQRHRTPEVTAAMIDLDLGPVPTVEYRRMNYKEVISEMAHFVRAVENQIQEALKGVVYHLHESLLFHLLHAMFHNTPVPPHDPTSGRAQNDKLDSVISDFNSEPPVPLWTFSVVDSSDGVEHVSKNDQAKLEANAKRRLRAESVHVPKSTNAAREEPPYLTPGRDVVERNLETVMDNIITLVKNVKRPSIWKDLDPYVNLPEDLRPYRPNDDGTVMPPLLGKPTTVLTQRNVDGMEDLVFLEILLMRSAGVACERADKMLHIFEICVGIPEECNSLPPVQELTSENADEFRERLETHQNQVAAMVQIPDHVKVGAVVLDARPLRSKSQSYPSDQMLKAKEALLDVAVKQNLEVSSAIRASYVSVQNAAHDVDEVVAMYKVIQTLMEGLPDLNQNVESTQKLFDLVQEFDVSVQPAAMASYKNTLLDFKQYKELLHERDANKDSMMAELDGKLDENMKIARDDMSELIQLTQEPELLEANTPVMTALALIAGREREHGSIESLIGRFTDYLQEFRSASKKVSRTHLNVSTSSMDKKQAILDELQTWLQQSQQHLLYRKQLWKSRLKVQEIWDSGDKAPTPAELADLQEEVTRLAQIKLTLERTLPSSTALEALSKDVNKLKDLLPIMSNLGNSSLCARHWKAIRERCPQMVLTSKNTLGQLLESNIERSADTIAEISLQASQEASVSAMLDKVKKSVNSLDFSIEPSQTYEQRLLLTDTETLLAMLEDSAVVIQGLVTSKFSSHVREELLKFDSVLGRTVQSVTLWLTFQRNWLFLMNIFNSQGVQRQLPGTYESFSKTDRKWQNLMYEASNAPSVVKNASPPEVMTLLEDCNATLDRVYCSLAEYLETKRMGFPRFFFLSDEELTAILANVRHPQTVEVHLRKCFCNVRDFNWLHDNDGILHAVGVSSHEGEHLRLKREVRTHGEITTWMTNLNEAMTEAVGLGTTYAIQNFDMEPSRMFVQGFLSQSAVLASQVQWARDVESALGATKVNKLKRTRSVWRHRLAKLADLVLKKLRTRHRNTLTSVITIEVHLRDVMKRLIDEAGLGEQDFAWQRQLRYHFATSPYSTKLSLVQWTTVIEHCMEFAGARPALVITPLTDRCFLTMMMAMGVNLAGAPSGPAGTGKTESVKELAKAAGKFCVVFNCSEALDYKMLGCWFSGMLQTGAWLCLDEFNRIDVEVLSVVSQLLRTIKDAKDAHLCRFTFDGRDINLKPTSAFFVTNNPGYCGRVELPQNLKEFFRPIAMTIPDALVITEVVLFSVGFRHAPTLSRKLVELYDAAVSCFSKAQHYDFGLRAVKSMLVVAGKKKQDYIRNNPGHELAALPELEAQTIVQALHETNRSKLAAADMPTFDMLVSALFPAVKDSPSISAILDLAVRQVITSSGLTADGKQITKAHQLHNTMHVRHGLMLIGPAGGGKTTILRTLATALNGILGVRANLLQGLLEAYQTKNKVDKLDYKDTASRSDEFLLPYDISQPSKHHRGLDLATIHPKCLSIKELYGSAEKTSAGTPDGLLARVVRLFESQLNLAAKVYLPYVQETEAKSDLESTSSVSWGVKSILKKPGEPQFKHRPRSVEFSDTCLLPQGKGKSVDKAVNKKAPGEANSTNQFSTEEYMEFDINVAPYGWRWVVLDGPVDSSWIENLNTTLDDTKMLSLASGERIYLAPGMRLVFEVDDLQSASPATISRCGMVYFDSSDLDWKVIVKKWMTTLPEAMTQTDKDLLMTLFETAVDEGLTLIGRYKQNMPVAMTTIGLITSLTTLLSGLLEYVSTHGGFVPPVARGDNTGRKSSKWKTTVHQPRIVTVFTRQPELHDSVLAKMFALAYMWSFGAPFQQAIEFEDATMPGAPIRHTSLPLIFDIHVRAVLGGGPPYGIRFPPQPARLMDFFLDFDTGSFMKWSEYLQPLDSSQIFGFNARSSRSKLQHKFFDYLTSATSDLDSLVIATPETARAAVVLAMMLQNRQSILISGDPGAGKSMLLGRCLKRFCGEKSPDDETDYGTTLLEPFFSQTTCTLVRTLKAAAGDAATATATATADAGDEGTKEKVEVKPEPAPPVTWSSGVLHCMMSTTTHTVSTSWMQSVVKKQRKIYRPPADSSRLLLAVEDLHMPQPSESGLASEVVRQFMDTGMIYDQHCNWVMLENCSVIATCKSYSQLPARLLRHFCVLHLQGPCTQTLRGMYACILKLQWLGKFNTEIMQMVPTIVSGIVSVCERAQKELHPTPSKPHYIFDTRDIGKAVAVMRCASSAVVDRRTIIKFLNYAVRSTFRHRINDRDDLRVFADIHEDVLRVNFDMGLAAREAALKDETVYTGLLDAALCPPPRTLAAVADCSKLNNAFRQCQDQYNCKKGVEPLSLVFFDTISRHVVRLSRVLGQPRGHAVLIGLVGTGRAAVARLAALMDDLEWSEVSGSDTQAAFKSCFRNAVQRSASEGKGSLIFVSTSQLSALSHLDAVSTAMQHGWLPGALEHMEMERLVEAADRRMDRGLRTPLSETEALTQASKYQLEERLKEYALRHIHIVVAMSSAGQLFRQVCMSHPQILTSALSVDWFEPWDDVALIRVATESLRKMTVPLVEDEEILQDLRQKAVMTCVRIHNDACLLQQEVESMGGQMMYITPNTYQLFIQTFLDLISSRGDVLCARKNRLEKGAEQLGQSREYVENLKRELENLQPLLGEKEKDMDLVIHQLEADKVVVDREGVSLLHEREKLDKEKAAIEKEVELASVLVAKALPALEEARKALNTISKKDIAEIRMYNKPPEMVVSVMCSVCELLAVKADWATGKSLLIDAKFMQRLLTYDCESVPDQVLKRLSRYTRDPKFTAVNLQKSSVACASLCSWVLAVEAFCKAKRVLDPRLKALTTTQEELRAAEARLGTKTEQHNEVLKRISELQAVLARKRAEYNALKKQISKTSQRLSRAQQIMANLQGEAVRWSASARDATSRLQCCVGDHMLVAASLVYAGVLNATFRNALLVKWRQLSGLPTSTDFSFVSTLEPQTKMHTWVSHGLPEDVHSSQNAVILTHCKRWPLLIDPQHQARRWITQMEKAGLEVIDWQGVQSKASIRRAMSLGLTTLIENVPSVIDPTLRKFIQCSQKAKDLGQQMSFSDGAIMVDCSPSFRLYLVSSEIKPNFLPDVFCLVTVINFTITLDALKDQLVTDILSHEMPDLERRRPELLREIAGIQLELKAVEDQMLSVFQEGGSILLDDDNAAEQLILCKKTADSVSRKMEAAERVQLQMQQARNHHMKVAKRGGTLFAAIQDLPELSGIHHFSSQWFRKMFMSAVIQCKERDLAQREYARERNPERRLQMFILAVTEVSLGVVLGGLEDRHRHIFALLAAVHVLLSEDDKKKTNAVLWQTLIQAPLQGATGSTLSGGGGSSSSSAAEQGQLAGHRSLAEVFDAVSKRSFSESKAYLLTQGDAGVTQPPISWLTPRQWRQALHLDTSVDFAFQGLCRHMLAHPPFWERWMKCDIANLDWELSLAERASAVPPSKAKDSAAKEEHIRLENLMPLAKLVLVRILRPLSLLEFVKCFAPRILGLKALPPPLPLPDVIRVFNNQTPVLLIVSEGSEPLKLVQNLAQVQERPVTVVTQAVGCGQGKAAEEMIRSARQVGKWVVLQNCHTAKSWMDSLEQIVSRDIVGNDDLHDDFRVWLTMEAVESVPAAVLQDCAKVSLTPISGFRENVRRLMDGVHGRFLTEEKFEHEFEDKSLQWKQVMVNMALLHSLLLEHNGSYRQIAWNEIYQFTEADFNLSCGCILDICQDFSMFPWKTIGELIGVVFYGGRVTDPRDHVTLNAALRRYLAAGVLSETWELSGIPLHVEAKATLQDCRDRVKAISDSDVIALMGLPAYAPELMTEMKCDAFVGDLKKLQPDFMISTSLRASEGDTEKYLLKMTSVISDTLPTQLLLLKSPTEDGPMERFARFECQQYNDLLALISSDMQMLAATLQANKPSNQHLDNLAKDLLAACVPGSWKAISYPTSLALGAWLNDLVKRMAFLSSWLIRLGVPVKSQRPGNVASGLLDMKRSSSFVMQTFAHWLGGMFRPKAFLTTLLMDHAVRSKLPMEKLMFKWSVKGIVKPPRPAAPYARRQSVEKSPRKPQPKEKTDAAGSSSSDRPVTRIRGMVLVGAGWDPGAGCLCELADGERHQELSIVEVEIAERGAADAPPERAAETPTVGAPTATQAPDGSAAFPRPDSPRPPSLRRPLLRQTKVPSTSVSGQGGAAAVDGGPGGKERSAAAALAMSVYRCPLYNCTLASYRQGVTATAAEGNFVDDVELPSRSPRDGSEQAADMWTMRGVALLCQAPL